MANLGEIPQEHITILVSSFSTSVQQNKSDATRKKILLHGTVKYAILDVSASFQAHLRRDPTQDSSGKISLLL